MSPHGGPGARPIDADKRLMAMIRRTYPTLDDWAELTSVVFVPPPGSELAEDDHDWPYHRLSQIAIGSLGNANDHLQAVRIHLAAGQLFPYAQSTLIRSALLSAAQAVWVLSPDDRETRVARSRCVAQYVYQQHSNFLTVLRRIPETPHEATELVAGHVDLRLTELTDLRASSGQAFQMNATAMIRDAGMSAFTDRRLVDEVESVWRSTSGAAHGLSWPLLGSPALEQSGPGDEDGVAPFSGGGEVALIANGYMSAFKLAEHGWAFLYSRSREATTATE